MENNIIMKRTNINKNKYKIYEISEIVFGDKLKCHTDLIYSIKTNRKYKELNNEDVIALFND